MKSKRPKTSSGIWPITIEFSDAQKSLEWLVNLLNAIGIPKGSVLFRRGRGTDFCRKYKSAPSIFQSKRAGGIYGLLAEMADRDYLCACRGRMGSESGGNAIALG